MVNRTKESYTQDELIQSYRKIPTNGIISPLIDWKSNQKIQKYLATYQKAITDLREELFAETDTERNLRKNKRNAGSIFGQKDLDDFLDTNIVREELLSVSEDERQKIRSCASVLIQCFRPYEGDVASIMAIAVRQDLLKQYMKDLKTYYQQNKAQLDRLGEKIKQFRSTGAVVNLESFLLFCYRKLEYDLIIM